jgi:hypothetical protein
VKGGLLFVVAVVCEELPLENYCYEDVLRGRHELQLHLLRRTNQKEELYSFEVLRTHVFEDLFYYLCFDFCFQNC